MKIWFVAFRRVGQQRELRYTKDVSIDISDARFPHLFGFDGIGKDSKINAIDGGIETDQNFGLPVHIEAERTALWGMNGLELTFCLTRLGHRTWYHLLCKSKY